MVSGGGREIYRRADIDRFLRRLADEGMTPEVANALDDDATPAVANVVNQHHREAKPATRTTKPKGKKRPVGRQAAAAPAD